MRCIVLLFSFLTYSGASAQDCIFEYQRADGMFADKGKPSPSLGKETLKVGTEKKIDFVTDWKFEKKKGSPSGPFYGSHARIISNKTASKTANVEVGLVMGPGVETVAYLGPNATEMVKGDIKYVKCAKPAELKEASCGNNMFEVKDKNVIANEQNLISRFDLRTTEFNPVNAYLLAKLSEGVYDHRLYFEIKHVINKEPIKHATTKEFKADAQKIINNENMACALTARFAHLFTKAGDTANAPKIKFFHAQERRTLASAMGAKIEFTHDPEAAVIVAKDANFVIWRGTDTEILGKDSEWLSTDFAAQHKLIESGPLKGAKFHAGFYDSFELLQNKFAMADHLHQNGGKSKPIWIAGHSLGGAQAIVSALYLKAHGYNVRGVYTYGSPRTIGDSNMVNLAKKIGLAKTIHRLEYFEDPITMLWAPGYEHIGRRHWYNNKSAAFELIKDSPERMAGFALKPGVTEKDKRRLDGTMSAEFVNHNPPFYTLASHQALPGDLKNKLQPHDPFPYEYEEGDKKTYK